MNLDSLYLALSRTPTGLRSMLYLVITCAAIACAPLVLLVAAVQWLGTRNRLPSLGEIAFALATGSVLLAAWTVILTFLLADGFVLGASECSADVVRADRVYFAPFGEALRLRPCLKTLLPVAVPAPFPRASGSKPSTRHPALFETLFPLPEPVPCSLIRGCSWCGGFRSCLNNVVCRIGPLPGTVARPRR